MPDLQQVLQRPRVRLQALASLSSQHFGWCARGATSGTCSEPFPCRSWPPFGASLASAVTRLWVCRVWGSKEFEMLHIDDVQIHVGMLPEIVGTQLVSASFRNLNLASHVGFLNFAQRPFCKLRKPRVSYWHFSSQLLHEMAAEILGLKPTQQETCITTTMGFVVNLLNVEPKLCIVASLKAWFGALGDHEGLWRSQRYSKGHADMRKWGRQARQDEVCWLPRLVMCTCQTPNMKCQMLDVVQTSLHSGCLLAIAPQCGSSLLSFIPHTARHNVTLARHGERRRVDLRLWLGDRKQGLQGRSHGSQEPSEP